MSPSAAKILLVEDSPSDAALLQESLAEVETGRFDVTRAETWAEAADCLARAEFDVLLLDLSLPDSVGRETFVRARNAAAHLPIVVLTSIADETIALDAMRHGIQDYLVKGQADGRQTARAIRYAMERGRIEKALQETQAALREANEQLERRVAARTAQLKEVIINLEDFSHSVIHDLRAPLRAVRAFAQFLGEECGADASPAAQDYVQRIITAAARMDKLIVDVLHYSRTSRGEMSLAPIDVSRLLRGILETYPAFGSPHVKIRIEEPLPRVLGNEAVLTQCFANLLDNALKFVAPGSSPRVRVWAEELPGRRDPTQPATEPAARVPAPGLAGDPHRSTPPDAQPPGASSRAVSPRVRLWFEDNGIGIPKEAQPLIFNLFQRLDNRYEGTGVGLAIVRKAVEKMGGQVGVESEPGQGSRFWLELRMANPPGKPARARLRPC